MKTRTIAFAFAILTVLCHKTVAQQDTSSEGSTQPSKLSRPFYMGLFSQVAIPRGPSREYSNARAGFRLEGGKSFKKYPSFGAGLELTAIFSGSKKDMFKDMEVKTSSSLVEIHPFVRWTPKKKQAVKPYIDFSTGVMVASTSTNSKIVHSVPNDTFLGQVIFGHETEVETVNQKSNTSANLSFSIGTGVIIKKLLMVGIRYQHVNPVSYIDKNDVYIQDNTIHYDVKRVPMDMIVVSIGISNWGSHK